MPDVGDGILPPFPAESRDKLRLYNCKLREKPAMTEVPKPPGTHNRGSRLSPSKRAGVTTLTQESHVRGCIPTGQSAAKPLSPLRECGRFRDYNQLGASLRYSPLPPVTAQQKYRGVASPRGMLDPSKFRVKCRGEAQDGTTGPAPAVIPALIAYVKVVAVKTLVVGIRSSEATRRTSGQLPFRGTRGAFAGRLALAKRASDCP
jgi:hypothetical protein